MRIKKMKVADLTEDPRNARVHDERNIAAIKASLERFGQQLPIVVNSAGLVVAGNGRLQAAREMGWAEIDTVSTDLEGEEATAFGIADNRTAELAEWHEANLVDLLSELKSDGVFEATGFDQVEFESMQPDFSPASEDEQGQLDEVKPKVCPHCGKEL